MNSTSRNQPCPCGSGKRYKHCCGQQGAAPSAAPHAYNLKYAALARQRSGDLAGAAALYRQCLELIPDEPDALHMLGVVYLQAGQPREAFNLILRAATLTGWQVQMVRDNLALALGALVFGSSQQSTVRAQIAYRVWCARRGRAARQAAPLVSVIVPSYNHGAFVEECLQSVYRQTWPRIELIVIDDGSRDDSPDRIRASLRSCPFPHRFIARENRGAHATINEGIELAEGEFINVLNSDDRFHPERIARMVARVDGAGAEWGFAGVEVIGADGAPAQLAAGTLAKQLTDIAAGAESAPTVGFALLRANAAISTGNLFVSKEFLKRIGGMRDLRYTHDWEFALRATLESEPLHVPEPLYQYRVHGANTILESKTESQREAHEVHVAHINTLLSAASAANPFAPILANWGGALPGFMLKVGLGSCMPEETIRELVRLAEQESLAKADAGRDAPYNRLPEVGPALSLLDSLDLSVDPVTVFDQWQRYGMAARAIERIRRPGQTLSILEVGANTHRMLGKLLPNDRITFLDREVPPEMRGDSDIVIGDATRLEMADGSYDVVVALDVFEHVDPARRRDFLHHATRVARQLAIIAAPFMAPAVAQAEQEAMSYWESLFGTRYRWLAEHSDNGLPDHAATCAALGELGVAYCGFGHGRLKLWQEMLKGHFAAEACGTLGMVMGALDRYYRARLFDTDGTSHDAYRQFLFCSRSADGLAPLRELCAEMMAPGEPGDMQPLWDVLAAIQAIGSGEAKRGR